MNRDFRILFSLSGEKISVQEDRLMIKVEVNQDTILHI